LDESLTRIYKNRSDGGWGGGDFIKYKKKTAEKDTGARGEAHRLKGERTISSTRNEKKKTRLEILKQGETQWSEKDEINKEICEVPTSSGRGGNAYGD